jgi:protein phosphatase
MNVVSYAAASVPGLLRRNNQDAAYAGKYVLAVADGMGGHAGGEIASQIAIDAIAELDQVIDDDALRALRQAVRQASLRLRERATREPYLRGMGTTLTVMLWNDPQVAFAHIGDSRAYLLRDGTLYQLTHDHTLVQLLLDDGRITAEQAAVHPRRSMLSRALDGGDGAECDLWCAQAEPGDRYLLCTDGLSGVVSADQLCEVLAGVTAPDVAVHHLIDRAYRHGGPDNVTCVVADVINDGRKLWPAGGAIRLGSAAPVMP